MTIDENEFVDIDVGIGGRILAQKNDKIALIDADTIAYIACVNTEQLEVLLPREYYEDYAEYEELLSHPNYDENHNGIWTIDLDLAYEKAIDKLTKILEQTGCQSAELYFTGGRDNFRYKVKPDYKANRSGMRSPVGLMAIKQRLLENYEGMLCTKWEADDIVVYKKKQEPEKYIMCAVDKDLLYSLPGKHFNYYESSKYNIDMKWMEVDEITAIRWPYMQCLVGDKTDNIEGIPGIGPKKAEKILAGCITHIDCWDAIVTAYDVANKTLMDAIESMRLVNMHQFNGKEIVLWRPHDMN